MQQSKFSELPNEFGPGMGAFPMSEGGKSGGKSKGGKKGAKAKSARGKKTKKK